MTASKAKEVLTSFKSCAAARLISAYRGRSLFYPSACICCGKDESSTYRQEDNDKLRILVPPSLVRRTSTSLKGRLDVVPRAVDVKALASVGVGVDDGRLHIVDRTV